MDGVLDGIGDRVGYSDPDFDGDSEGILEGRGTLVGWIDGMEDCLIDGDVEEITEGILVCPWNVGLVVAFLDGLIDGFDDGISDCSAAMVGFSDPIFDGDPEGKRDGIWVSD